MKVLRKTVLLTLSIPVQVGGLVADMEYQFSIFEGSVKGKPTAEYEWVDLIDIYFQGVALTNYNKFKDFHLEMGIDYDRLLHDKAEAILSDKVISDLIKSVNY